MRRNPVCRCWDVQRASTRSDLTPSRGHNAARVREMGSVSCSQPFALITLPKLALTCIIGPVLNAALSWSSGGEREVGVHAEWVFGPLQSPACTHIYVSRSH